MAKTIAQINEKIAKGKAVVVTAEEIIDIVDEKGAAKTAKEAAAAAETEDEPEEVDWTGTAQKWVPIFSLEREGLRVGMAQVAGPTVQVDQVKGVYQLRLDFKSIGRIFAYVPVSTISTKVNRVQGVSVWALADIKVLGF